MTHAVRSDQGFFLEKEEYQGLVATVAAIGGEAAASEAALDRMDVILRKYQEQSNLLDPHLEGMVVPLMEAVRAELSARLSARSGAATAEAAFPFEHDSKGNLDRALKAVYLVCRTRGYKAVLPLMPHGVADVEPCLLALLSADDDQSGHWESRYVLLLWLSMLVLVPFQLSSVDSAIVGLAASAPGPHGHRIRELQRLAAEEEAGVASDAPAALVGVIISHCAGLLGDSSAVRDAAAVCLGRLLTRPDHEKTELPRFVEWATSALRCAALWRLGTAGSLAGGGPAGGGAVEDGVGLGGAGDAQALGVAHLLQEGRAQLLCTGILTTLVRIAKHGQRQAVAGLLFRALEAVAGLASGPQRVPILRSSSTLRKLTVKLAQRTGLAFLPPRVVAWRYNRGRRSLLDNMGSASSPATAATAAPAGEGAATPEDAAELAGEEALAAVVGPIEEVVDQLLVGLADRDGVVRWSAAKGVGRLTSRLPLAQADDVVAAVLELLAPEEPDTAWHGGCLALAELARRGLLLPRRLPQVAPLVVQALRYDVRRGGTSVGSHVRDAACYVCWAFARAYAPPVMAPHVRSLASAMLAVALFDREVNCRRAAAAAFQENVGRQGAENFPRGIAIITAADYFTLGNRANAFLRVAPQVCKFPEYRQALISELADTKLRHWDAAVRRLAARALAQVAGVDPVHMTTAVLPPLVAQCLHSDVHVRHGAFMAVAETTLALARRGTPLPKQLAHDVIRIVPRAEAKRAYLGRGGLLVRAAACLLIRNVVLANLQLSRKGALRLLKTLEECMVHPHEEVQRPAAAAFRALAQHHLAHPEPALRRRLAADMAKRCRDENPAKRRGAVLALGRLPRDLFLDQGADDTATPGQDALGIVVQAMCRACRPDRKLARRDAETRRNAVESVACLVEGIGARLEGVPSESNGLLTPEHMRQLWAAVLTASRDYLTDTRGDVGSWVRRAACVTIERLLRSLAVAPLRAAAGRPVWGAMPFTPQEASGQGAMSGAALVAAACEPQGLFAGDHVRSRFGLGRVKRVLPCGTIAEVEFAPGSAGTCSFPYGSGLLPVSDLEPVLQAALQAATDQGKVPAAEGTGPLALPHAKRLAELLPANPAAEAGALLLQSSAVLTGSELSPHLGTRVLAAAASALLRMCGEKLDVLRGEAGDALCRVTHDPVLAAATASLPFAHVLRAALPLSSRVKSRVQTDAAVLRVALLARDARAEGPPNGARSATVGWDSQWELDAEAAEEEGWHVARGGVGAAEEDWGDDEDEQGGAGGDVAVVADAAAQAAAAGDINYSVPQHMFPRLVPLMALPTYTADLVEGLVLAVGGLSESVVKTAQKELADWLVKQAAAGPVAAQAVRRVAASLATLLRGRTRRDGASPATMPAAGAASGAGSGDGAQAAPLPAQFDSRGWLIERRLTLPVLRCLHLLLQRGAFDLFGQPPAAAGRSALPEGLPKGAAVRWPEGMARLLRRRLLKASDPVRLMEAGSVWLELMDFGAPAGPLALRSVLDLLGHQFPKVRRVTAERLSWQLQKLQGDFRAGKAAFDGAAADRDFDRAVTLLMQSVWDGAEEAALRTRDDLYAALGQPVPEWRIGAIDPRQPGRRIGYQAASGAAGDDDPDDPSSYLALVREAGY